MTGPWFPWITRAVPIGNRRSEERYGVAGASSRVNEGRSTLSRCRAPAEKDSVEAGAKQAQDATHAEGEREEATQSEAD